MPVANIHKKRAESLFRIAGIEIDGNRPSDITVLDDRFYQKVFSYGSIGLGESYMDSWWDAESLDEFFAKLLHTKIDEEIKPISLLPYKFAARLFNLQKASRAFEVGEEHYDVGNDLYKAMLDKRMVYTCGYWSMSKGEAQNLDEAQVNKLDLVCRKIDLKQGQCVLDIGCGWGSFAKFAAEEYGAHVIGITVSKEQVALGKELTKGLPVEIRFQDYRSIDEQFDHVVSLGMFEHVGYKNYRTFMETVHRSLNGNGLFLLHTIGKNKSVHSMDPWIEKYIFPNSMVPSIAQIGTSVEELFVMEDWHNFSADYDKTLMEWMKNIDDGWEELRSKYNARFYRMWKYYLMSAAGSFRSRQNQLWQIVLSKNGVSRGYKSVR